MSYLITAVVFIIIFSLLILIHEFGHFWMAKRAGIKVEEFGFGLPPRIWGKKKGETLYSVNWIPFGGFVRMLGEDSSDPSMLRKKRSFVAQSMRDRVLVIVAGVVMNFLLAWALLTIGLTAGMQPLLTPDDILPAVNDGQIILEEGVALEDVVEGSLAYEAGMRASDVIVNVDGQDVAREHLVGQTARQYKVVRGDQLLTYEILTEGERGFVFGDFAAFPRVKIFDLNEQGRAYSAGLRSGDTLISVNGEQVYNVEQYEEVIRGQKTLEYVVYRNGLRESFLVELDRSRQVVISRVLPGGPAEENGLQTGDVILSVNGLEIDDSEMLVDFVANNTEATLAYLIERNGERLFFEIEPRNGVIGVLLSELMGYYGEQEISLYNADLLSSVVEIKDQQYPIYKAPFEALGEISKISKLTAKMFGTVIVQLFTDGSVPTEVAGPVGIAQMTHVFVQEGLVSVLRFVAILSLSLAVINILPLPALDGGRLLFIIIELIIGKRVNQKWESLIHALGYVLILLLILAVTYSDILKLFAS